VVYIAYKLIVEAKHWWQDEKVVLIVELGSEIAITWGIFKHEFNWHFVPQSCAGSESKGIHGLGPRKNVVRFFLLLRFGMFLIPYEEKKVKNYFERGMSTHILTMMTYFDICNFS
jgi:hypothetical protein